MVGHTFLLIHTRYRYAKLESHPEAGMQVGAELYSKHALVYYLTQEDAITSSRSGNVNLRRGSLPLGWAPFLPVRRLLDCVVVGLNVEQRIRRGWEAFVKGFLGRLVFVMRSIVRGFKNNKINITYSSFLSSLF